MAQCMLKSKSKYKTLRSVNNNSNSQAATAIGLINTKSYMQNMVSFLARYKKLLLDNFKVINYEKQDFFVIKLLNKTESENILTVTTVS